MTAIEWRTYNRREVIQAGFVGLATVYLTACGGNGGSGGGENIAVTFDMEYVGKPGAMKQYWEELRVRLGTANEKVKISDIAFVPFTNLEARLQNAHAAKKGSTIETWFADFSTYQFVHEKSVVPVEDYLPKGVTDDFMLLNKIGGKHWAAPYVIEAILLVGNRKHLDKAGVQVGQRFKSWEAFTAACGKLKQAGFTPVMMGASDGFAAQSWLQAATMDLMNSLKEVGEFALGKIPVDTPGVGAWAERFHELRVNKYVNDDAAKITHQQSLGRFLKGDGTFIMVSPAAIFSEDPKTFRIIGYWDGPGRRSAPVVASTDVALITSYGANKEAAGRLLAFMQKPEQLKLFNDLTGEFFGNRRFDPSGLGELPRAAWKLMPEGIWPASHATQTTVQAQFDLGTRAIAGDSPAKVLAQYEARHKEWRNQNPTQARLLEDYLGSIEG